MPQATSDPITRGVIRHMLPAIADEMSYVLQRSSYNMMIYEVRDYCCALVAPDGALLAQNMGGVSHFVSDLGVVIADGVERYGLGGFQPGDGVITNHQRVAGQHLNNVVTYTPVFADGQLICFAVVRAHWIDVGGLSTGFGAGGAGALDPWAEGLQLDQVRLYEGGQPDAKVLDLIRTNIRFPESSLGDMRAQFAACRLGGERITELVAKYGVSTLRSAVAALFADTEERCRRVVATIPDGEYFAESFLDGDPADPEVPIDIKVRVVISGSDMTIDLTRCSPQRRGAINARTLAGAYIAYKALTTPDEPVNEGSFRALTVEIQEGNFMMATFPAPMAAWSVALPTVVDTVLRALATPLADWAPAAHFGTLGGVIVFVGTDRAGTRFVTQSIEGGGWGARPTEDGPSASVSVCQGDVRNAPVEAMELKWPVRVERREFRQDSGGAGRFRGGLGLVTEVTNLVDGTWRLGGQRIRRKCPAWGLQGGEPGAVSAEMLRLGPGEDFEPRADARQWAPAGSTAVVMTAGGGGWGDPRQRPAEAVARDVLEGLVSARAAREHYGVVVDPETGSIDAEATALLRSRSGASPDRPASDALRL
jgi:N-methylhydantoinase B